MQSSRERILDVAACASLVALVDEHPASRAGEVDTQVQISLSQLAQVVGTPTQTRLLQVLDSPADTITLRRVEACTKELAIGFHTDVSFKTMQVPLNAEADYQGGQVVFATQKGFLCPSRAPGSYTVHDQQVLCCAVLCCAVLCCAVLCCAALLSHARCQFFFSADLSC